MHGVSPALYDSGALILKLESLNANLTLTVHMNSIMPEPTGIMDHLNISGSVLMSTEVVHSGAGGSSFENSLHYVHWQVGWFSSA